MSSPALRWRPLPRVTRDGAGHSTDSPVGESFETFMDQGSPTMILSPHGETASSSPSLHVLIPLVDWRERRIISFVPLPEGRVVCRGDCGGPPFFSRT